MVNARGLRVDTVRVMDLPQLRYLVATVDHGTPHAAARALRVPARTLTRGLRLLERELGRPLLVASSVPARPTPLGQDVVASARRILADVDGLAGLAGVAPQVVDEPAPRGRASAVPNLAFAGADGALVASVDGSPLDPAASGSGRTPPRTSSDRSPVRLARAVRDRAHIVLQADFHAGHRSPRRGRDAG
jgi:hypothetical protein